MKTQWSRSINLFLLLMSLSLLSCTSPKVGCNTYYQDSAKATKSDFSCKKDKTKRLDRNGLRKTSKGLSGLAIGLFDD